MRTMMNSIIRAPMQSVSCEFSDAESFSELVNDHGMFLALNSG